VDAGWYVRARVCEQQVMSMPAVLHAHWKAADARTAVALANWTEDERVIRLQVPPGHGMPQRYHLQHDVMETRELGQTATLPLRLPPLGVALVECGTA